MSGPWSPASIEASIPVLIERMEAELVELKALGIRSAQLKWEHEAMMATARRHAEGSNAEDRKASAMLWRDETGHGPLDTGMAMDMAANAYGDSRQVIRAIDAELSVARTLLVSHREVVR